MSEAVLKRKTRHIKVPISGIGKNGFSLNGGYRNTGAVGPVNLGRRFTRTLYKGAYPIGAGGCCGEFVQNILSNNTCCTNDPNIVKRSTMNTNGLILATITYPTPVFTDCSGSCVKNWVKDFNALNYSQGMFIRTLKIKNICPHWLDETTTCNTDPSSCKTVCSTSFNGHPNTSIYPDCNKCDNKSYFIGTRKVVTNTTTKKMREGAISSSDYITGLLQARQCLPPPPCKAPFPMALNHQGCDTNYMTPEEAIEAGALPQDWGTCSSIHYCGQLGDPNSSTHCAFKSNPYTHCWATPLETRLACPQLGCPAPSQAAVNLWKALVNVGKWAAVVKIPPEPPVGVVPVVAVISFENIAAGDLPYVSNWWRGTGNPEASGSSWAGQRCHYAGPWKPTGEYCIPYGYSKYPPWGDPDAGDDCASGPPSSDVIEWFDAHRECILLKVTYEDFDVCGGSGSPSAWDAPDGHTSLYKADLGNPNRAGNQLNCSARQYDSITLTRIMAIPYGYTEPLSTGPSTSPLSIEQLQNGSYGSPSDLLYIDCIDWHPLPNKSAPWRLALTTRSLESEKPIGIGGIESLFFKLRSPYQGGDIGQLPWATSAAPTDPFDSSDDAVYVPLDASNSCPIPPPSLKDIKMMTAYVRGAGTEPNGYYNFTPRWRYWTTAPSEGLDITGGGYSLYLEPDNGQFEIVFDITQFPLPAGYTRDPVQVKGAGIPTTPAVNNSITVSTLKNGSVSGGEWTDADWGNPAFYQITFTTSYSTPTDPTTAITEEYTVFLKRDSTRVRPSGSPPPPPYANA